MNNDRDGLADGRRTQLIDRRDESFVGEVDPLLDEAVDDFFVPAR